MLHLVPFVQCEGGSKHPHSHSQLNSQSPMQCLHVNRPFWEFIPGMLQECTSTFTDVL
jgi:hypothetical protein